MQSSIFMSVALACAIGLAGCSGGASGPSAPSAPPSTAPSAVSQAAFPATLSAYPVTLAAFPVNSTSVAVCVKPPKGSGTAACKSKVKSPLKAIPIGTNPTLFPGYAPVHLQAMFGLSNLSANAGAGSTVAIVTAYVDQNLASDLAVYRAAFSLPACSVANHCLSINIPTGNAVADAGWAAETALDAEMVSAICPACNIAVFEAKSAQISDLAAAVDQAAATNPSAISNSYSTDETQQVDAYAGHYFHPNMAIVVAAGDDGYGPNFPAVAANVVAVGGISMPQKSDGSFGPPTVWTDSASGCSSYIPKPAWQSDAGCAFRTHNDIAALADPDTGVMGYSTQDAGWNVYGGTSVATPMIASMYTLGGGTAGMQDASALYSNRKGLYYVTGSDGTCSPAYLCTGGPGYNGPIGEGVPYGLSALQ